MEVPAVLSVPPSGGNPAHRRLALRLAAVAAGAFAFGFALVPLYGVFCRVTGLNGKTNDTPALASRAQVDASRTIHVEFSATPMPGATWDVQPDQAEVAVHPGQIVTATYTVRNPTGVALHGRAVPSVSPGEDARYLTKIDCFCFRPQTLAPGERRQLPVTFYIDPAMPDHHTSMTLSYAFYPADPAEPPNRN